MSMLPCKSMREQKLVNLLKPTMRCCFRELALLTRQSGVHASAQAHGPFIIIIHAAGRARASRAWDKALRLWQCTVVTQQQCTLAAHTHNAQSRLHAGMQGVLLSIVHAGRKHAGCPAEQYESACSPGPGICRRRGPRRGSWPTPAVPGHRSLCAPAISLL